MKSTRLVAASVAVLGIVLNLLSSAPAPHGKPMVVSYRVLGDEEKIYALAFSPDGKRLLAGVERSGSENDQVVEWDIARRSVSRRFSLAHSGQTISLRFSPSGRWLVIGQLDGRVSVSNPAGRVLSSFKVSEESGTMLELATISERNGVFVNAIVGNNLAQRRDLTTERVRNFPIPCDDYRIHSAAGTRDGAAFVCCSPKFVNLYPEGRFDSPRRLRAFDCFEGRVITHVAIADDASTVVAFESNDGYLAMVDAKNDRLIKKWKGHDERMIYTIIPFHRRNWFATGNDAGEIEIWDEKGGCRALLKHEDFDLTIASLALTRDDGLLASSGVQQPIVVWDLRALLAQEVPKPK